MSTLCLDPSLRAFGWAVIEGDDFVDGGCLVTKRTSGSLNTSDIEDLVTLTTDLKNIIVKYNCNKVRFEVSVGSKSSRANQTLSYVKALVVTLCTLLEVEFEFIQAKSVKKTLVGDNSATKQQILEEVSKKFKSFDKKTSNLPKFKLYAVSDAAAVYLGLK